MKILNDNYLKVNSLFVDVNVEFKKSKINIIRGENGIGKTSFSKKMLEDFPGVYLCFQHRLESINTTRVEEMLHMLIENKYVTDQVYDFLNYFSVDNLTQKVVNSLSGGENQILKIIIALGQKRNTLIFDEPSQYLDKKNLKLFKELLLQQTEKMIILIEHNDSYLEDCELNTIKMYRRNNKIEVIGE